MSLFDSVTGVLRDAGEYLEAKVIDFAWKATSGTVSPMELARINKERDAGIARASGVGVGGKTVRASDDEVKRRQSAAAKEVEDYLRSRKEHPDQAGFRIPFLDINLDSPAKVRSALILVIAAGLGLYFGVEILKAYVSRRR